jgi:hypothetical protein
MQDLKGVFSQAVMILCLVMKATGDHMVHTGFVASLRVKWMLREKKIHRQRLQMRVLATCSYGRCRERNASRNDIVAAVSVRIRCGRRMYPWDI